MNAPLPQRIHDLEMPEIGLPGGITAREADRRLLALAGPDAQDTTHFDTVRFPPPAQNCSMLEFSFPKFMANSFGRQKEF